MKQSTKKMINEIRNCVEPKLYNRAIIRHLDGDKELSEHYDGLVAAGVIQNDGWTNIGEIRHKFDVDKQDPRVEVRITEVS